MPNRTATVLAILVAAGIGVASVIWPTAVPQPPGATIGMPVVMRTPGGLLEVATLDTVEVFVRRDPKDFFGIPLGETVSEVRAPVRFRYHVELAREWPVTLSGRVATVRAPPLEPSLPVAFDTARLEKQTRNGWARFNREENLAEVERSMSTLLAQRARSPEAMRLVREDARRTLAEFATKWLMAQRPETRDGPYRIEVLFPDEPGPGAARTGAPQE